MGSDPQSYLVWQYEQEHKACNARIAELERELAEERALLDDAINLQMIVVVGIDEDDVDDATLAALPNADVFADKLRQLEWRKQFRIALRNAIMKRKVTQNDYYRSRTSCSLGSF